MTVEKDAVKKQVSSLEQQTSAQYETVKDQAKKAVDETKSAVETQVGNVAGEVNGGIESITEKTTSVQDKLQNTTVEGLVTDGVESLEGAVNGAIEGSVTGLLSKFGLKQSISWEQIDSDGAGNPVYGAVPGSLDLETNSTIAGILKLITGLGVNSGFVQNVAANANPAGLKGALENLDGKISNFTDVNALQDKMKEVSSNFVSDLKNTMTAQGAFDPGSPDGAAADSDFTNNFEKAFNSAATDVENEITEGIKVKDVDKTLGAVSGKDGKQVLKDITSLDDTKNTLTTKANDFESGIDKDIASSSSLGLLQGFTENLTNTGKNAIKKLNPKLTDEEVTEIVGLSQGTNDQKDEAIAKIARGSSQDVSTIRRSVLNLNTTIAGTIVVDKSKIVLNDPFEVGIEGNNWTADADGFSYVTSLEELESELRQTSREITEAVVHWTDTFTNRDIGSEEIDASSREISGSPIGYHYVIRRDGSLQRGRPLKVVGEHADTNGHNNYSIGVAFVGGYNCPSGTENPELFQSAASLTRAQMTTFEQFCRIFYMAYPGGFILGHNDIDLTEPDPGFDVKDYVADIFGKSSSFSESLDFSSRGPVTPKEIVSGSVE